MRHDLDAAPSPHDALSRIVRIFLDSNLSIILIVFSLLLGAAALLVTAREEDPQIVVPLADIHVSFPGRSAAEVEQLVATPLERLLYQIDGVEYVYSMSRENGAIVTVRFYVGEDRERSIVKIQKKLDENLDAVPPGVAGWVVKPIEIDDVPVVTLTLTGAAGDSHVLRRVGEELVERLAVVPKVSRTAVFGGEPREVRIELGAERLQAYSVTPAEVHRALRGANVTVPAGEFTRGDATARVDAGATIRDPRELGEIVVGVFNERPVALGNVAEVRDGPAEATSYVRHGWGMARGFADHAGSPGTVLAGPLSTEVAATSDPPPAIPAVTVAISKQKGANAVAVADAVLAAAKQIRADVVPDDVEVVVTRNYGLTADEKVNELVEALGVAIVIVIALLTISLGWREALIVAVAIPVVFGLTLAVNLLAGYTINRVTLFALILSLGLLVDDPIVDVENIARHFEEKRRASRDIVLAAVAEIRPPLISATLAVIVSFLPMFFITGMMGPYMSPMALNVPVAMLMSMVVAFTITPWLTYHVLKRRFIGPATGVSTAAPATGEPSSERSAEQTTAHEIYDPQVVQQSLLYRVFRPLMTPLLATRLRAWGFLLAMAALTAAAAGLAATRSVPLKMLPFDNKNELLLVLDMPEGTTLERTAAVVADFERYVAGIPEATDYTSYVGLSSPMDFNGLVRHYYLRRGAHQAELRLNLVGKKHRREQSHALGLRHRDALAKLAERHGAVLQIVELPPGPPVLATLVAEVYGRPDQTYDELLAAAATVARRMRAEPGVEDVDDFREAAVAKLVFEVDQEKAALAGVSAADVAETIRVALGGANDETLRVERERAPLRIVVRLPRADRSSHQALSLLRVKGSVGQLVPLAEIGAWRSTRVDQTIYHKNLRRVAYVLGECAGRPPAECVVDIQADRIDWAEVSAADRAKTQATLSAESGYVADAEPRPVAARTYFDNGSGIAWSVPHGVDVRFSGEGEWNITLDVFRDLGLAFGAAMLMIYIILVAQTGSFLIPLVVMLAIPLTVLGVMPGFWALNAMFGQDVGGYADSVFFTATAMIGMIALSGIVTRDSIILVDFMQLAERHGRPLFDAILESRVVRLRPILLTAGAAMLSSIPITLDPIFSGLGWSLIFGLLASTVFTLFVIPVVYWLIRRSRA
ncbi:MAG: AcrB/AcrD/AcrF family protein [Planctomycetota bacterium]|nr:MAG: AcrB/AcrD/AcrF family protein [Planctomycetota bacterium]